jgi:hypothetical protein
MTNNTTTIKISENLKRLNEVANMALAIEKEPLKERVAVLQPNGSYHMKVRNIKEY